VFAISTARRWSNPTENEIDVFVDVNGDGLDDYIISALDIGQLTTGEVTGELGVVVTSLATGESSVALEPDAPFNSSTMELPVLFSQLCDTKQPCPSPAHPRITYHVVSFGLLDATTDALPGTATFNIYAPAISTGMFDVVDPGESVSEPINLSLGEWRVSPALGLLVRTADNAGGPAEAQLIPIAP